MIKKFSTSLILFLLVTNSAFAENNKNSKIYISYAGELNPYDPELSKVEINSTDVFITNSDNHSVFLGYNYKVDAHFLIGAETGISYNDKHHSYARLLKDSTKPETYLTYSSIRVPLYAQVSFLPIESSAFFLKAGYAYHSYKPKLHRGSTGINHSNFTAFAPEVTAGFKAKIFEDLYLGYEIKHVYGESLENKIIKDKKTGKESKKAISGHQMMFSLTYDLPF